MEPDTLILTAAAAAATRGTSNRVTVNDIRRELATLTNTRIRDVWLSKGCGKNATGAKISTVLRKSRQYTPIKSGNRIVGFIPVKAGPFEGKFTL